MEVIAINSVHVPTKYEAYLQTEQFNNIRQAVLARDGYKCVVCGSTDMLQAHHLTYRNLYHEPTSDLITLCRKCHSIYHAVDKRRAAVDAIYQREDEKRMKENWDKSYESLKKISAQIAQEIKEEYLPKDYCKNGDMDMTAWEVLNPIIDAKCKQHGIDYYSGDKTKLRAYFHYRRCEFLLRCMDKGLTLSTMVARTKFGHQWLAKWYRRDKCEAKLNEEKELYKEA